MVELNPLLKKCRALFRWKSQSVTYDSNFPETVLDSGFRIVLYGCGHFVYQEYDSTPVQNFDEIVGLEPEILGVEKGSHPVVVNCVMGSLTMSYGRASIYLDSGEEVSFDELAAASKKYWDAWAADIPQRR